jgi:hypothetical protein
MNYVVLVQELPIYSGRWLGCKKVHGVRKRRTRRKKDEDDKSYHTYIAVTLTSSSLTIRNPKIQIHTLILNKLAWQKSPITSTLLMDWIFSILAIR